MTEWDRSDVPIVFEDQDLFVIEKPPGLVVHPAPGHSEATLAELFADQLERGRDIGRRGIVHRLDRGTSGLMVMTRSEGAHSAVQQAIQERRVERKYLALVGGRSKTRAGRIEAPIGRSPKERHRMAVNGAGSRNATTHFEVVESLPGASLVEARLETGRTHQIRVHMASIGHPLAGDETYGGERLPGLERPFLHSACLAFEHPVTGQELKFESPLPEDLSAALQRVRAHGLDGSG